jgi:hypothetical protein
MTQRIPEQGLTLRLHHYLETSFSCYELVAQAPEWLAFISSLKTRGEVL